jgi:hypothetical protein
MSRRFAIGATFTIKVPIHVRRACFNACNIGNSPHTYTAVPSKPRSAQDFRDGRRSAAGPIRDAFEQLVMHQVAEMNDSWRLRKIYGR